MTHPFVVKLLSDNLEDVLDAERLAVVVVDGTNGDNTSALGDVGESGLELRAGNVVDVDVEGLALLLVPLGEDLVRVLRLRAKRGISEGPARASASRKPSGRTL